MDDITLDDITLDDITLDDIDLDDIIIEPIEFKEHNLWDLNQGYTFFNDIETLVNLIKEGKITKFQIKDKYTPGEKTISTLDVSALNNNIIINYTDELHNVAYLKDSITFISTTFYEKYKNEIKKAFIEQIKHSNRQYYTINNTIFSDELFDVLLEKENSTLYFENVNLSEEQIDKLKDNLVEAYLKNDETSKQISSKYVFGFYTKEKLKEMDNLTLYINDLQENNILNLRYLKENSIIKISSLTDESIEEERLTLIQDKLKQLNSLGKKFNVKFKVEKRSIYNKLFKNLSLDNLNIIIENDLYEYSENEYKKEDAKLENLVSNIKNSELSPFEKYIAVYNIVKNIKPYKENTENAEESRYLRYILDNEYIVCVGYAKLLIELLDKVGINACEYSVSVDTSYDKGFTLEEKVVDLAGHARVIVNIDDDKYKIHGLYLSDPTWDNNLDKNFFNNVLLTFDSMQISNRMFTYARYNPILDIHSFKEYNDQINFLLKRKLEDIDLYLYAFNKDEPFPKKLIIAYEDVAKKILNTINCDSKYNHFIKKLSTCEVEKDYIDFYTEMGHYLLNRINKEYDKKAIFIANKEVIKALSKKDNDLDNIDKTTQDDFYERDTKFFPYTISEDNNINLEDKKTL